MRSWLGLRVWSEDEVEPLLIRVGGHIRGSLVEELVNRCKRLLLGD